MDELRALTKETFLSTPSCKKSDKVDPLKLIRLSSTPSESGPGPGSGDVKLSPTVAVNEYNLFDQLWPVLVDSSSESQSESESGQDSSSNNSSLVRLVIIPRAENDLMDMSQDRFLDLFDRFDIDPVILQQIGMSGYGFHHYDEPYRNAYSFYLGTYVYSIAWSYNPVTMQTSAIVLLRTSPVLLHGQLALRGLQDTIQTYQAYAHTPFFLVFTTYIQLCRMFQGAMAFTVRDLRDIETLTGHGPGRGVKASDMPGAKRSNIHDLSAAAQQVAIIQVHLANLLRHDNYLKSAVSYLLQPDLSSKWHPLLGRQDLIPRCDLDFEAFMSQIPVLQKLASDYETSLKYLQTRAQCQSSVIFSMMTHEDADLSAQLAAAAKKDSSAMKSIAMMTMFFLPGTFFAALFAMPSTPDVIDKNFWIYWVCTGLSTLVVFVVWRYHHSFLNAKARHKYGHGHGHGHGQHGRQDRHGSQNSSYSQHGGEVVELHKLDSKV